MAHSSLYLLLKTGLPSHSLLGKLGSCETRAEDEPWQKKPRLDRFWQLSSPLSTCAWPAIRLSWLAVRYLTPYLQVRIRIRRAWSLGEVVHACVGVDVDVDGMRERVIVEKTGCRLIRPCQPPSHPSCPSFSPCSLGHLRE